MCKREHKIGVQQYAWQLCKPSCLRTVWVILSGPAAYPHPESLRAELLSMTPHSATKTLAIIQPFICIQCPSTRFIGL